MFAFLLDFLEALPALSHLVRFFRKSDTQKAKDVEVKVDGMSDADVDYRLRDEWTNR